MKAAALLARLFSFPLLGKELTEAAARRRTYTIRVVYGVLLIGVIVLWMPQALYFGGASSMQMGAGVDLFRMIIVLQFAGLVLFLPALMAGAITHEKERDSLVLLLLTNLKPWSIVLQKFIGCLVPVLSFLLLAMPLTAIAYAFGGVSSEDLFWCAVSLLLTALQMGALTLLLSAWSRTTVGAFVGSYFCTAMLYVAPPIAKSIWESMTRTYSNDTGGLILFPMLLSVDGPKQHTEFTILKISVIVVSIGVFLALARFFLVRRAFLPASSIFLRLFRILDRVMQWANRFVGNVVLVRDLRSMPDKEPVFWREITRKALGKAHYLFRILVAVEIPVALVCGAAMVDGNTYSRQSEGLSFTAAIVGAFGVLALGAQAANTIVSERIQQTLDVLLTTPIGAAEIVRQKAQALRRVQWLLTIPLLTIFGAECWTEHNFSGDLSYELARDDGIVMYLLCALLAVFIFLPLVSWLALWIGLKTRTRFKAIVTALAAIVAWCVLPLMAAGLIGAHLGYDGNSAGPDVIRLFSPISIVAWNEMGNLGRTFNIPFFVICATFSFYGFLLWLIRRQALRHADFYLRR